MKNCLFLLFLLSTIRPFFPVFTPWLRLEQSHSNLHYLCPVSFCGLCNHDTACAHMLFPIKLIIVAGKKQSFRVTDLVKFPVLLSVQPFWLWAAVSQNHWEGHVESVKCKSHKSCVNTAWSIYLKFSDTSLASCVIVTSVGFYVNSAVLVGTYAWHNRLHVVSETMHLF